MAQTQEFIRKGQVQVVVEATQDTHVTPAATDGSWPIAYDVSWMPSFNHKRTPGMIDGYLNTDEVAGARSAQLSFSVALKGSGSLGVSPDWADCLKACGFKETVNSGTSVVYTPVSTFDGSSGNPGPSYSVNFLGNGRRYALSGAFGNVSFAMSHGEILAMTYTFTGSYVAVADDALEAPTYDTASSLVFQGAAAVFNVGATYTPVGLSAFNVDMGNVVSLGRDVTKTSGFYGARLVNREITGSCELEMVSVATYDWYGKSVAGTTGTFTTGTIGSTAGNRVKFDVARLVLRTPEHQDRDGIRGLSLPFSVSSLATDTEASNAPVTLTLT